MNSKLKETFNGSQWEDLVKFDIFSLCKAKVSPSRVKGSK
jgi:hypothetical protein